MRRHLVLGLLTLLVTIGVACGETQPAATPVPIPSPTPTATPTPTPPPPQAILEAAIAAMQKVASYHFDMDLRIKAGAGGISFEIPFGVQGDFQTPDRVQGTVSIDLAFIKVKSQFVSIGGTTYVTSPETGEWETSGEPITPLGGPEAFIEANLSLIKGLAFVGYETLDGVGVYHLRGVLPEEALAEQGASGELQVDYWVGVKDNLLRQIVATGEIELEDGIELPVGGGEAGRASLSATVKLSDFGKAVTIEAPKLTPSPTPVAVEAPKLTPSPTPVAVAAPKLTPSPTPAAGVGPFGPTKLYKSAKHPFTMEYPAGWTSGPPIPALRVVAYLVGDQTASLAIVEEDTVAEGLGTLGLQQYTDVTLSAMKAINQDFQLAYRSQLITAQGMPAEVLEGTAFAGTFKVSRLIYLHEGRLGFSATYLAPKAKHEELAPLIAYSFSTFQVTSQ